MAIMTGDICSCRRCLQYSAAAQASANARCDPDRRTCNGQRLFYCGACGPRPGDVPCSGACPRCYRLFEIQD